MRRVPLSGALFLAGFLAITGSPPFGPFLSEFTIVNAALGSGQFLVGGLFLLLLGVVFIGMGATVLAVVQGKPSGRRRRTRASATVCGTGVPDPRLPGAGPAPGRLHPAAPGVAAARGRRVPGGEPMNAGSGFAVLRNGQAIDRGQIPDLPFADVSPGRPRRGRRRAAGRRPVRRRPGPADRRGPLRRARRRRRRRCCRWPGPRWSRTRFPSLTPDCPQVHLFEREIAEQYGVRPEGHPWLKPVRFHASYRPGHDAWGRSPGEAPVIGVTDFYRVEGEEIHEVAVGPGPRRRHRAGPFPLPVPRRAGLPPGDLAGLPAPRGRAGARRRARTSGPSTTMETRGRRHVGRPRDGLLPGGRSAGRLPGAAPGRGAPRRRPGAGAAGQPHRRPRRPGRRRRLPADRFLLRPAPRRFPEH